MLTVSTVLGKDNSHGSPDGKATGRPRSSCVCTCYEGALGHRVLAVLPTLGMLQVQVPVDKTAATSPTA